MSESAGRVLQIHKGTYSDSAVYNQLDEVLYNGSTYVAKQSTIGNIPTNTTYWQLVAQKGADGTSGQGVPAGGTTGQVLTKHSNNDYDAEWGDALSIEEARENELISGKNLAVFNPFVGTESSVSTVVSDASTGELTLNGSASGSAIICISDPIANPSGSKDGSLNLKAGTYVLSSPQYSALSASFYLAVVDKNGNKKASFQPQSASDDHVEFTLNSDTNGLFIAIYLSSGASFSSQKLQVMICTLADWTESQTYGPYYAPLKDQIDDLELNIVDTLRSAEVVPSKNLFDFGLLESQVVNGVTITVERDENGNVLYYDLNGTASANTSVYLNDYTLDLFPEGEYVYSDPGAFLELLDNTKGAYTYLPRRKGASGTDNHNVNPASDENKAKQFTVDYSEYDYFAVRLYIFKDTVLDHHKLYPMICTLADWNASHTYEPHYVPVKDRDIVQTITISGLSNTVAKKMGKIVSIVFNNENVGTLLGKTLPTELLPAADVHCLGLVRADTTLVHNMALFDYTENGNLYLYYTPTYGANRVAANTSSTNLLFTGTITYISKY